jgi:RNA-binding protein PNO1
MEPENLIEQPQGTSNMKKDQTNASFEMQSIIIPPNRMTPLKNNWEKICQTVVKNMKLQIRMNPKKKTVDIRECE